MEAREGGLFITTTSGSDIRKSRFTRAISLPVMSDVTAPPFYWRIARLLILPRSGGATAPLPIPSDAAGSAPFVPSVGDATGSARNDASPTFENTGDEVVAAVGMTVLCLLMWILFNRQVAGHCVPAQSKSAKRTFAA